MPQDASMLRSPAWTAMPDDDDEEADQVMRGISSISGTFWWLLTSTVMLAFLLQSSVGPWGFWSSGEIPSLGPWQAPWWLTVIFAAEAYASIRRLILRYWSSDAQQSSEGRGRGKQRNRRLRHFTSLRLAEGAPVDEIVARFLALDALSEVRSVELGSNSSTEKASRGHSLALMVSFSGHKQRAAYLNSPERIAFRAFAEPFVDEWFVFDFESGVMA
jgi:hypothetical protein